MGIPVAKTIHVRIAGSTSKVVRCESCPQAYRYEVRRCGQGEGIRLVLTEGEGSRALAERMAADDLQKQLASAIEVVPCPACGWIQSDMIPLARRRHLRRVKIVGILLLLALVLPLIMAVGGIFWPPNKEAVASLLDEAVFLGFILLAAGGGLLVARAVACRHYDPNINDVDQRLAEGRRLGVLIDNSSRS